MTIEEKLKELKRIIPFKWRVQSTYPKTNPTAAIMIPYVDARDIQERLDEVIGASGWQNDFKTLDGKLFCGIGIKINSEWVWKWDIGTASQTEKDKGMASDAFKRCAVHWGINRDAYSVGTIKLKVKEYNGKPYPCDDNGNFLKGSKLYEICNELAKISELDNYDTPVTEGYLSEFDSNSDTEKTLHSVFAEKYQLLTATELTTAQEIIDTCDKTRYNKLLTLLLSK